MTTILMMSSDDDDDDDDKAQLLMMIMIIFITIMITIKVLLIMLKQPTQIFAKKAQLSARVVIPPVGLKLEVNFKDGMLNVYVIGSLCHHVS